MPVYRGKATNPAQARPQCDANLTSRGAGRPKGTRNKVTYTIQQMLLASLDKQGGQKFFDKLAVESPKVYAQLIGRLIPLQLSNAEGQAALQIKISYTRPEGDSDAREE